AAASAAAPCTAAAPRRATTARRCRTRCRGPSSPCTPLSQWPLRSVSYTGATGLGPRWVVQAQVLVDFQRRRGVVERDEVQSGHSLGQQPRAELRCELDTDGAYRRRIVLGCEDPLFQGVGEHGVTQLWQ